ncbi:MAG: hypothetical protein J5955_05630 [Bacilli bacterium]|nr:hypothetical protein [Bacilli bacterium]
MEEDIKDVNVESSSLEEPSNNGRRIKRPKSKARKIIEWVLLGIFLVIFGVIAAGTIDSMIHAKEHYGEKLKFGIGSFVVLTNSMEPKYNKDDALITYKEDMEAIVSELKAVPNATIIQDDESKFIITMDINDTNKDHGVDITFKNINMGIDWRTFEFVNDCYKTGQMITTGYVMTHRIMELHVDKTIAYGNGRYTFVTAGINHGGTHSLMGQYQFVTEKNYLGTVKVSSQFLGQIFKFVSSAWGLIILLLIPAAYLIVVSGIDIFRALKDTDGEGSSETKVSNTDNSKKIEGLEELSDEDRERLKRELLDQMIEEKGKKK